MSIVGLLVIHMDGVITHIHVILIFVSIVIQNVSGIWKILLNQDSIMYLITKWDGINTFISIRRSAQGLDKQYKPYVELRTIDMDDITITISINVVVKE